MGKMKTPEEAKALHCCGGIGSHCVADKCMAWQWASLSSLDPMVEHHPDDSKARGYCSLTSVKD